jgi:predicted O-linked N-acetylglucosamine transferase (SPINDLY family)
MGVPVLTLNGSSFISRMGEGFNMNVGLADWIAMDKDDFIRKAYKFSSNAEDLAQLKRNLRARLTIEILLI